MVPQCKTLWYVAVNSLKVGGKVSVCLLYFRCIVQCFLSLFLVVSANEIDCLERLVSEMTYYVSSGTLNFTHSVIHLVLVVSLLGSLYTRNLIICLYPHITISIFSRLTKYHTVPFIDQKKTPTFPIPITPVSPGLQFGVGVSKQGQIGSHFRVSGRKALWDRFGCVATRKSKLRRWLVGAL